MQSNDETKSSGEAFTRASSALTHASCDYDNSLRPRLSECDRGILHDLQSNSARVRALLFTHGNTERKKDFVESVAVLSVAGTSEVPLFKALLHGIPLPKAYMMAACLTPLYMLAHWCIPFSLAKPQQFFQAIMVAKTRMLANASADPGRIEMYNAARDKLWKDYVPNEAVPPSAFPRVLDALGEPYWSFTTYRTQVGESRAAAMRYVPVAPMVQEAFIASADDLSDAVSARRPILATSPQQRHYDVVLTDDDLDDIL